ncbi:MAG: hypothetical protein ACO2OS_03545 [Thermosphaera aggregans]|uniref:hypothetical protein n=1 Tax=Thermosphaera aggregans TaxID=54254 RepID=UPI003BFC75B3
MSERPLRRTVGRAVYDISKDTELIGIFGEAFFDTLLMKKKMVKLDNAVCISLNKNYAFNYAVHALHKFERYNHICRWGLEPIFEELWRRKNAYEVFDEIWRKLSVFIKETGIVIEDLEGLCANLQPQGLDSTHKCNICGENYKPPNFRIITLKGAVNNRVANGFCLTISICEKCYERLLEKDIIKKPGRTEVSVREEYLRNFALLRFYCELHGYLEYLDFIAKVGNIDFFMIIGAGFSSSLFDFMCIDNNGEKYVIDVKTTTSQVQTTSKIISKELKTSNRHIQLALNQGFRVLLPVVRLEKDWKIILELVEITQ